MKIFISGICGFVGSELALGLRRAGYEVSGCDNFSRAGSELNLPKLEAAGVEVWRGDVRCEKDLERSRGIDWVIDAAANTSVLAGVDGKTSSRELLEHNLWGTVNLLEVCKRENAGMILLSTSRVYSIPALCELPVKKKNGAFVLEDSGPSSGPAGLTEDFPTSAPISLYGASKLASEKIALEYGAAFGFPVWVNRCGVMAGAGQFGKADQGIFSFWIHSWAREAPLKYIGFGGAGHQVRDCLHPEDLLNLVLKQMKQEGRKARRWEGGKGGETADEGTAGRQDDGTKRPKDKEPSAANRRWHQGKQREAKPRANGDDAGDRKVDIGNARSRAGKIQRIFNVGGGAASVMSLKQLSDWCAQEFGPRDVAADLSPRPFDLPWVVLDSSRAEEVWDWKPQKSVEQICAEIAQHARENPEWLSISRG